jgi:hypothetical protein
MKGEAASCRVDAASGGRFLKFLVTGTKTPDTALKMWREIGRRTMEEHASALLVDDRTEGGTSPFTILDIHAGLTELGLSRNHRIALVGPVFGHQFRDAKFAETVAQNRGWFKLRAFEDVEQAEAWLEREEG